MTTTWGGMTPVQPPQKWAADVLPGAVAVQRVQDRAGDQVQLRRVPVQFVCHHVIVLAVSFPDLFVYP